MAPKRYLHDQIHCLVVCILATDTSLPTEINEAIWIVICIRYKQKAENPVLNLYLSITGAD
jgi:hypothetical protein